MDYHIGTNERLSGNLIQGLYKSQGSSIVNQICKYISFTGSRRLILIQESINAITNIDDFSKLQIQRFLNYFISLIDAGFLINEFEKKTINSELYHTYIKDLERNRIITEENFNKEAILCMLNTAVHNFLQSYNILNSIEVNDIILIDGQNFIGNILTKSAYCGKKIDLFDDFLKLLEGKTTILNQQNFLKDLQRYNILNNKRKQIKEKQKLKLFDSDLEISESFLTPVLNQLSIFNKSVTITKKDGSEYIRKLYSIPSIKPFFNNLILKLITEILSTDKTKVVCFGLRDIDTDIDRFRPDKKYIYKTESNSYIAYSEGMGFNRRKDEDGIDYATWTYGHDSTDDFCLLLTSKYLTYIGKLNSVLSNDNYGWLIRDRPCRTFLNNITTINEFSNFELESSEIKSIIDFRNLGNINVIKNLFDNHDKTYKIEPPNILSSYNTFAILGHMPSILCSPISIPDDTYRKFCQDEISLPTIPKLPKSLTIPKLPKSPTHATPKSPTHATPKSPTQVIPKSSTQVIPKSPTHATPKSPTHATPKSPTQVIPKSPTQVTIIKPPAWSSPIQTTTTPPRQTTTTPPRQTTIATSITWSPERKSIAPPPTIKPPAIKPSDSEGFITVKKKSEEEKRREYYRKNGYCLNCGSKEHLVKNCPRRHK